MSLTKQQRDTLLVLLLAASLPAAASGQERLRPGDDGWIESITHKLDSIAPERMRHRIARWEGNGFSWKHGAWVVVARPQPAVSIPNPKAIPNPRNGEKVRYKRHVYQWVAPGKVFPLADCPKGFNVLPYFSFRGGSAAYGQAGLIVRPVQVETAQRRDN